MSTPNICDFSMIGNNLEPIWLVLPEWKKHITSLNIVELSDLFEQARNHNRERCYVEIYAYPAQYLCLSDIKLDGGGYAKVEFFRWKADAGEAVFIGCGKPVAVEGFRGNSGMKITVKLLELDAEGKV